MTTLTLFVRRLRRFIKTGKLIALKEAFIAGSHLLMHTAKVIVAVILIYKFFSVIGSTYTIKPFSVPKELAESGYTSTTVIKKIMEEREKILNYNDGSTSQSRIFFRATSKKKKVIETEIEEGKEFGALDIDAIFKTGKKILGIRDKIISGEITTLSEGIVNVKVYMFDKYSATFAGKNSDIDSLLVKAAEYITEQTTPQYLVEYLIKNSVSKNDSSSLEFNEKLLDKADKLLSTLEYNFNNNDSDKDTEEEKIQLVACRTSWHLAKAIEYQLRKKVFKEDSVKWAKAYDRENLASWKVADTLKSSNDLAHYVLKLSILMSLVNYSEYDDSSKVKDYEYNAKRLIEEYRKNYERNYRIFSASFSTEKSDYFETNQAKGFINLSIGYLSSLFGWEGYKSETYYKNAIIFFHSKKASLIVDNNEIAALNSYAYYFKRKAQKAQENQDKSIIDFYKGQAKETLDKALRANKGDGNIYDTYAETIFDLNGGFPDSLFYEKIRQALSNPKPVDGITVEGYRLDSRWKKLCRLDKEFIGILDSFKNKDEAVLTKSKPKKKSKSDVTDLPPQYGNTPQKALPKSIDTTSMSARL